MVRSELTIVDGNSSWQSDDMVVGASVGAMVVASSVVGSWVVGASVVGAWVVGA